MKKILLFIALSAFYIFSLHVSTALALKKSRQYYAGEMSECYIDQLALKDSISKLNHTITDLKHWCK